MKMLTLVTLGLYGFISSGIFAQSPISISTIEELQQIGQDVAYPLGGDYVITQDINASATATWNDGRGFSPIGGGGLLQPVQFTGSLDGQGHSISGLVIYLTDAPVAFTGLFAAIGATGRVENLGLTNCQITGQIGVGALAARNGGFISGCHMSGTVHGTDQIYMGGRVGGLVGENLDTGVITNSYTSGTVHSEGDEGGIGGLVGVNSGAIDGCHSEAVIIAAAQAGGLVGIHKISGATPPTGEPGTPGTLTNSYATGAVTGESVLGGLVGQNGINDAPAQPVIADCHATGSVSEREGYLAGEIGGLVGNNKGRLLRCYAEGSVSGDWALGGLVGRNNSTDNLLQCYATGNIAGNSSAGGLVGVSLSGNITQCFALGNVTVSNTIAGGFAGELSYGAISDCFSTGTVTAESTLAGFATVSDGVTLQQCYAAGPVHETVSDPHSFGAGGFLIGVDTIVTACFWDMEASGVSYSTAGEGMTTVAMMQKSTYTDAGWDMQAVWGIDNSAAYPCLRWASPECGLESNLAVTLEGGTVITRESGDKYTFKALVSDALGTVAYQWYFDDGDKSVLPIEGPNGPEFHIPYISEADAGWYSCAVTDDTGTVTSAPVRLVVVDQLPLFNAAAQLALLALLLGLGVSLLHRSAAGHRIS